MVDREDREGAEKAPPGREQWWKQSVGGQERQVPPPSLLQSDRAGFLVVLCVRSAFFWRALPVAPAAAAAHETSCEYSAAVKYFILFSTGHTV